MLSKVYAVVWSKWRPYMSVGAKTVAAFSMIIAVLAGGFYYYIDTTLSSQARSEAVQELSVKARGAVGIYRSRMAQMKYGMLQAGSMESVQRAISGREGRFLRETIDRFAGMRPYVDYWAVVDADGNSIVSRNGTAPAAVTVRKAVGSTGSGTLMEDITVKRIISRALSTGTAILTTEVVESGRFGRISAEGTATAPERPKRATELMQVVVTPVTSGSGVTGAFVTGILLDGYG